MNTYNLLECAKKSLQYSRLSAFKKTREYKRAKKMGWLPKISSHLALSLSAENYYLRSVCKNLASICSSEKEFRRNYPCAYLTVKKNEWQKLVSQKDWRFKESVKVWEVSSGRTKKECKKEALKYRRKSEFQNKAPNIYHHAWRHGWLQDICKHMKGNQKRTFERVLKDALKYSSRVDFARNDASSYQAASQNGWLQKVCKHMGTPYGSSKRSKKKLGR